MGFLSLFAKDYEELQKTCAKLSIGPDAPPSELAVEQYKKVTVNCSLRAAESKWGKHKKQDAALLHIKVDVDQETTLKLKYFVFEVQLSHCEPPAIDPKARQPKVAQTSSQSELYLLEDPWPAKPVGGPLTLQHRSRKAALDPNINAGVGSGTLGSLEFGKEGDEAGSWSFKSSSQATRGPLKDKVRWTWQANHQSRFAEPRGPLYGALVTRATGSPVYLLCRVCEGQLFSSGMMYYRAKSPSTLDKPFVRLLEPEKSDTDLAVEINALEQTIKQWNEVGVTSELYQLLLSM